jgi:hypothetical protein
VKSPSSIGKTARPVATSAQKEERANANEFRLTDVPRHSAVLRSGFSLARAMIAKAYRDAGRSVNAPQLSTSELTKIFVMLQKVFIEAKVPGTPDDLAREVLRLAVRNELRTPAALEFFGKEPAVFADLSDARLWGISDQSRLSAPFFKTVDAPQPQLPPGALHALQLMGKAPPAPEKVTVRKKLNVAEFNRALEELQMEALLAEGFPANPDSDLLPSRPSAEWAAKTWDDVMRMVARAFVNTALQNVESLTDQARAQVRTMAKHNAAGVEIEGERFSFEDEFSPA